MNRNPYLGQIEIKDAADLSPAVRAFREAIAAALRAAIQSGRLLDDEVVDVTLMPTGQTSVVYRLTTAGGGQYILKVIDWEAYWVQAEAAALRAWAAVGVRVPAVERVGYLDEAQEIPCLLLEFVSGADLLDLLEREAAPVRQVQHDLGAIQARLHQVRGQGFGRFSDEHGQLAGQFPRLQDELTRGEFQTALEDGRLAGLLDDRASAAYQIALARLDDHAGTTSALIHTDFRAGNILYNPTETAPYILFDPAPRLSHPYLCLAYSLILETIHGRRDPAPHLAGYESVTPVVREVLDAAVFLEVVRLLPRWGVGQGGYAVNLRGLLARVQQSLFA